MDNLEPVICTMGDLLMDHRAEPLPGKDYKEFLGYMRRIITEYAEAGTGLFPGDESSGCIKLVTRRFVEIFEPGGEDKMILRNRFPLEADGCDSHEQR